MRFVAQAGAAMVMLVPYGPSGASSSGWTVAGSVPRKCASLSVIFHPGRPSGVRLLLLRMVGCILASE